MTIIQDHSALGNKLKNLFNRNINILPLLACPTTKQLSKTLIPRPEEMDF
jgi:hypothetical protein